MNFTSYFLHKTGTKSGTIEVVNIVEIFFFHTDVRANALLLTPNVYYGFV